MGRPINYKKLGGDPAQDGEQLVFSAWFEGEGAAEPAYLVKQVATRRYRLAAVADDTRVGIFTLGDEVTEGEFALMVTDPFGSPDTFAVDAVTVTNSPTFSGVDGTYEVTFAGGDPIEALVVTFVITTDAITSTTITSGGKYPTNLNGVTLTGTLAGEAIEVTATTIVAGSITETANKIMQHRVITNEGGAYKYDVDVAASEDGDADLTTE